MKSMLRRLRSAAAASLVTEDRRVGVWRPFGDRHAVRPRDRLADREPVDRRALRAQLLGLVVVDGQGQRHLARRHQLRQQRVPFARGDAIARDDLAEE